MDWKFWSRKDAAPGVPKQRRSLSLVNAVGGLFKGGQLDKNDMGWTAVLATPDQFITLRQRALVARSREQWSNNDFMRKFVALRRTNVVGPHGVMLQAQVKKPRGGLDQAANDALEAAWKEWGLPGNCDVSGRLSWRALQNLAVETDSRDGEFMFRMVYGPDAGPWGFALQVLDPQRCRPEYNVNTYKEGGIFIRHGIEFNRFGRPLAYHFDSTDEQDAQYYSLGGRGMVRIPADEMIHGFVQEIAGQKRGLPPASTSLFRMRNLTGFEDAAIQNARAAASKMGFIQYAEGFGPECDPDEGVHIDAEPLSFHELPEGASLAEFNPQYPSGEYAVFHKAQLRGISSGMNVPYNELANDLEGVNFSSIRQNTLDAREGYKELQQHFIESLVMRVYENWLRYSLLAGKIKSNGKPLPADRLEAYRSVAWQGRRWAWIDPRADVDGAISSMRAGLKAPSEIIRESGKDPADVYRAIADDIQSMKAAGIDDETITLFMTGAPPPPEPPEPPEPTNKAQE